MRVLKFLAVFLLAFVLAVPTNASAKTTFSDISKDYRYSEEVNHLIELGIINGYPDGTFKPDRSVTRSQAAVMLARALDLDVDKVKAPNYKDVSTKSPSYKEIAAITEAGIMKGDKGKFNPSASLTRSQMAIVLTRAFDLIGDQTSTFTDVAKDFHAYKHIDAMLYNGVTTGYPDGKFKPQKATSRVHFSAFLSRALNNVQDKEDMVALLDKVYENEFALDSYKFSGDFNFGLSIPEELQIPEMAGFTDMLEDIQVEMTGAYVKDPMHLETNIKLTMSGEFGITMNVPMIMTEEKMWYKFPEIPMMPMPEELAGKYIEIDLTELEEMEGLPSTSMDYDLQMEFASVINKLFIEQFGPDFYKLAEADALQIPNGIDTKEVVKFELTNETLQPFVEKMMTGYLPKFFEIMQDPKYADILGISAEDFEEVEEGFELIQENLNEIVATIHETVSINTFDQHIVINQDDQIAYDVMNLDVDITSEEGVFGLKLGSKMHKTNMNEEIEFVLGIPSADEVITMEELEDIIMEDLENMEDMEDFELAL